MRPACLTSGHCGILHGGLLPALLALSSLQKCSGSPLYRAISAMMPAGSNFEERVRKCGKEDADLFKRPNLIIGTVQERNKSGFSRWILPPKASLLLQQITLLRKPLPINLIFACKWPPHSYFIHSKAAFKPGRYSQDYNIHLPHQYKDKEKPRNLSKHSRQECLWRCLRK